MTLLREMLTHLKYEKIFYNPNIYRNMFNVDRTWQRKQRKEVRKNWRKLKWFYYREFFRRLAQQGGE